MTPGRPSRAMLSKAARAFALPIVLALTLAVSLGITVMLQRQSVSRLTTVRELEGYRMHHASRGLRELLDTWRAAADETALAEITLEGEQRVLTAELEGGGRMVAYISEAQGLLPTVAVRPEQTGTLAEALRLLTLEAGPEGIADLTRQVGPDSVHVLTAPVPVLRAVAEAVTGDPRIAQRFARQIDLTRGSGARRGEKLGDGPWLKEQMARAGVETEAQERLMEMLVVEPTLFRARVEVFAADRDRVPTLEYAGLFATGSLNDLEWQRLRDGQNFLQWGPVDPALGETLR